MGINKTFGFSEKPPEGPIEPPKEVTKIEKDRHEKEEGAEIPQNDTLLFKGAFLALFQNILIKLIKDARALSAKEHLVEHLKIFKKLLIRLQQKDQSSDPSFAEELSLVWHQLLQDIVEMQLLGRRKKEEKKKVNDFMEKIRHFPTKSDHSLGFYFSEYAGEQWLPFPFLEILKNLHEETLKKKSQNTLKDWIEQLDLLIKDLIIF